MLGLDVCEFGGQVLELLWLTMCYKGLMADKKDVRIEEEEDDRNLNYIAPVQKSLDEIRQLDKDDESLVKYKQTLLGMETMPADPAVANVQMTRLTLLCDEAPEPITMDLTDHRLMTLPPRHPELISSFFALEIIQCIAFVLSALLPDYDFPFRFILALKKLQFCCRFQSLLVLNGLNIDCI
ncbi:rho GDP-dissociation inhibitor 3 isoform X2 [Anarhichas minor]|uniref:rho GDP-dissociation inhibitor 3 isoform X2 n=1 Tax=Anarhichas minor TaxID=65739 RepID=UPI003F73DE02